MINKLIQSVKQFFNDEKGMGAIEYALIVAVMAAAITAGWGPIKTAITTAFTDVSAQITKK